MVKNGKIVSCAMSNRLFRNSTRKIMLQRTSTNTSP